MGFLIGFGMERPRLAASVKRMTQRPNHVNYSLNKIRDSLFKIKHWEIRLGTYSDIENEKATWFIDPPYQYGGECYPESNRNIDFKMLGEWCLNRDGQVIVCENTRATWMGFLPLARHKTRTGFQKEAIWSNVPTPYDMQQSKMFL